VPPSLLRVPSLRQGLTLVVALYTTFGAFMFVYALAVQGGLGFSAVRAGLVLSPMATGYLVSSLQMARLVERYGGAVVTAGALLQLAGLGLLASVLGWSWPHVSGRALLAPLALMGLGQGLMMPAAMRLALSDVPLHLAGAGGGVLTTTQQVSLACGVAAIGSLFLTLSSASRLGTRDAFLTVVCLQALVAVGVALGSRRLPRAR
jgi:MFS family permease